jgi:hypothetical protein
MPSIKIFCELVEPVFTHVHEFVAPPFQHFSYWPCYRDHAHQVSNLATSTRLKLNDSRTNHIAKTPNNSFLVTPFSFQ